MNSVIFWRNAYRSAAGVGLAEVAENKFFETSTAHFTTLPPFCLSHLIWCLDPPYDRFVSQLGYDAITRNHLPNYAPVFNISQTGHI
jgi:hypothetical protein